MLINELMDKLNREADIAASLFAKERLFVERDEIFSDLCVIATKAMQHYGKNREQVEAKFSTYLDASIRNWLHDYKAKKRVESVTFLPLEQYEIKEDFDPSIAVIMGEIRDQLSDQDAKVFDCMLYEDTPTRNVIGKIVDLTGPQVMHSKKRIRNISKEIMEA